ICFFYWGRFIADFKVRLVIAEAFGFSMVVSFTQPTAPTVRFVRPVTAVVPFAATEKLKASSVQFAKSVEKSNLNTTSLVPAPSSLKVGWIATSPFRTAGRITAKVVLVVAAATLLV